jgi:hypothetical protein
VIEERTGQLPARRQKRRHRPQGLLGDAQ